MANFQTHLNVGIVVSAGAALTLHTLEWLDSSQTFSFFVLGVVGSLLPDIDSKTSKHVNLLFSLIGAGFAFVTTLPFLVRLPPLQLTLVWAGVYLIIRHGFFELFTRLTVHRGIWHSWLAIAAVTLAITNTAFWLWHESPQAAWLAGAMTGIGYFTHLLLDELYSVDLLNRRIKRSFGTALKPFSYTDRWSNLLMFITITVLVWLAPDAAWLDKIELNMPVDLETLGNQIQNQIEQYGWHISHWWQQLISH